MCAFGEAVSSQADVGPRCLNEDVNSKPEKHAQKREVFAEHLDEHNELDARPLALDEDVAEVA